MRSLFSLLLFISISLCSCYFGFRGISIQPEVNTFYVQNFSNRSNNNAPDIEILFAEALRQKVRDESKLTNNEEEPDVEFLGSVKETRITAIAPQEGNTTSLNRMEIFVEIEYINHQFPDESWKKSYSAFQDYDRNQDFNSIRDRMTDDIIENIMERVFNDAFTNW